MATHQSSRSQTRIFLSSTYIDLVEHRRVTIDALNRLGQHIGCMEVFGARPNELTEACLTEVKNSDLFVGVYAHRYGHVPPQAECSITEQEFRQAREVQLPCFVFLVDPAFEWPIAFCEGEPAKTRLDMFKCHLQNDLIVDYFKEPLDLAMKVVSSVGRYLLEHRERMAIAAANDQAASERTRLIELLEIRALAILDELPADERARFEELHRSNVGAIRRGELLLSHLLTDEVHRVMWLHHKGRSWEPPWDGRLYGSAGSGLENDRRRSQDHFNKSAYPRSTELGWGSPALSRYPSAEERRSPDSLLDSWLQTETTGLKQDLAVYRRDVTLIREADVRGQMIGLLRGDGVGLCAHCEGRFHTSPSVRKSQSRWEPPTWDGERCPHCKTRIELSRDPQPEHLLGHEFVGGVCRLCGCGVRAVRRFQWICKPSE